jgi:hypothetical protein
VTSAADLLSNPSTWISRAPAAAFRRELLRFRTVWAWLSGLFRPGSVHARNRQPPESDIVHDHVRLSQHQIVVITALSVAIGTRHVQHLGRTEGGETMGGSSCGGELSTVGARPK